MARPVKDVVDYFPHDAHASDTSDTIAVLQERFNNDGYAFWFKLLEKLASTNGHCLDLRQPAKWLVFVSKMGVSEVTTVDILNLLVEMQAIDKGLWQSKLIWCQHLVDNVSDVYKNRRRPLPQKPVTTDDNTIHNGISTDDNSVPARNLPIETPQSKVKESKVKESKVNIEHIEIPEWVNVEIWDAFLEVRKRKKAPQTKYALELIVKTLGRFRTAGDDPNAVLERSIMNGWKGVFQLGNNGAHQQSNNSNKRGKVITDPSQFTRPEDY